MYRKLIYLISLLSVLCLAVTGVAQEIDPNLVGWWKLDETSGNIAADSSGMGNYGTTHGNPQWYTSEVGGALDFDGEDDYVALPIGPIISSLTDSTFAIWANFSDTGGAWQRLWDFGTGTDVYMFLSPRTGAEGPMRFAITTTSNTGESTIDTSATLPTGWHHVAVVIDGVSRNMRLQLDGDVVASGPTQTLPADLGVTTQNWVGRSQWADDAYYTGSLRDFRIYNRALTIDEVEWLGPPKLTARRPEPSNGAVITITAITLSWAAGQTADSHHLYFGENLEDVTNGTGDTDKGLIKAATYTPESLEIGKTYYWRVDELEADGVTIHPGPVWSFTISQMTASNPVPVNGTIYVDPNVTLTWYIGSGAIQHHVYFGESLEDVQAGTGDTDKGTVETAEFVPGLLESGKTYYWRIDEFDGNDIHTGDVWNFTTMPVIPITDPNLVGWWTFDEGVGTTLIDWSGHNYHGVLIGGPQWVDGYDSGALKLDGVDDYVALSIGSLMPTLHEATLSIWVNWSGQGGAWQRIIDFGSSTANYIYLCPWTGTGFNNSLHVAITADNGLWNEFPSNKGILATGWHHIALTISEKNQTIIMYLDGENVGSNTNVENTLNDLGETTNNYLGKSQYADPYFNGSLDDFRIYNYIQRQEEILETMRGGPLLAWNQKPVNRAITDVEKALPLIWSPGEKAVQHDVYFGTDALAVEVADTSDTTGTYRGRQDANSYTPPEGVEPNQIYCWRIDEVNTDGTISKGRLWSFTVADFLIVDDFEDYDDANKRIYDTWLDYFVNNTGMTVGHFDPPYAEQEIVHSGVQAMYMRYDNDGTVNEGYAYETKDTLFYSEAERQWLQPQDWTRKGVNSLNLWFRGLPGSLGSFTLGPPITMTAIGTDIAGIADQFHFAYKRLSGNGSITAKVLSVSNTDSSAKAGVMIRQTLEPGSVHAAITVTPASRAMFLRRIDADEDTLTTQRIGASVPRWVRLTRSGNTFTAQHSANGTSWTTVGTPLAITMLPDIYVGLCLTSRNADAVCTAEFSDVDIDGTVTGDWQSQDIGLKVNAPEQLYVALQDSAGNSAVVNHPDSAATTIDAWTQWSIPLTDFSNVNLQAVTKMAIGVGDRANLQAGGAGDLYIDDIVLYLP